MYKYLAALKKHDTRVDIANGGRIEKQIEKVVPESTTEDIKPVSGQPTNGAEVVMGPVVPLNFEGPVAQQHGVHVHVDRGVLYVDNYPTDPQEFFTGLLLALKVTR